MTNPVPIIQSVVGNLSCMDFYHALFLRWLSRRQVSEMFVELVDGAVPFQRVVGFVHLVDVLHGEHGGLPFLN